MFKQLNQIFTVLSFSFILLLITACQPSDLSKKTLMKQTSEFLKNENPQAAIELLEKHIEKYDQDVAILQLLAQSHLQANDPFTDSIILLNAYELDSNNANILGLYFKSLKAANMNTDSILPDVAKILPDSLNRNEWKQLSGLRATQGKFEDALDAYFKHLGTKKITSSTPPEDALQVGYYYLELSRAKEAKPWLSYAANANSIEALPAQMKLMSIELQEKEWSALDNRIELIEKQFPGALNASSFSELPKIVSQKLEEQKIDPTLKTNIQKTEGSSKLGYIQNIEDLEAFANQVAQPLPNEVSVYNSLPSDFNPTIEVKPADPYLNEIDTYNLSEEFDSNTIAKISQTKLSDEEIDTLITEANQSVLNNELEAAAEIYRKVLKNKPNRHEIWDRIAQIYFANEEYNSAESASLQAIRLQQSNIVYTINYLNIARKTKSEIRFLSELLSASKQFPNSPEITLSLARAYDRNSRYRYKAKDYYTKFITLAPNHPQRSEAEAAISRLP